MSWKSKNQKKSDDPNLNSRPHFFDWFKHGSIDNPKPTGTKSSLESIKAAVRRKTRTEPHRKRIDLLHGGKKKESGDDGKNYKEGAVVDARKKPQRLFPGRREEEELQSFNGLESSGPALSREDSDLTLQRFAADWLGPDAPPSGHARKPSYYYESDEEEVEEDDYAEEGEDFEGSSSLSRENSGISLQRFAADWLGPVEAPRLDKRKPQAPSRISGGKNGGSFGNGQGFGSEGPWGGGSNSSSYLSRESSDDVALQRFAAAWLGPPDGRKTGFFGEDSDEEEDEEGLDHFMGHEAPHQPHLSRESSDVALQRLAAEWIGPFSVSSPLSRPLDSSSGSAFSAEYSVLPPLPLRPLPRLASRLRAPPKRLVQVSLETDTSVNNQRPSHLRASSSPELSLVAPSIFTPNAPFTSQTNAPSELPLSLPQPPLTRPVSLPRPPRPLLPQSSLQAQVPTPSLVLPQPPAPLPSNESLSPQPPARPSSNEVLPPQPSAPPSLNEVLPPQPSAPPSSNEVLLPKPSPSPSAPPPPPPPPQLPKPAPSAPPPPPPPAPKPPKPPQPPAPPPPMAKKAPPPPGNAKPGLPSKDGANASKLKPLHWEKVQADPSHSTVWEKVRAGSFHLNEDVVESLFGLELSAPAKDSGKPRPALPQKKGILDPKKSQNITIQLRALHLTKEEIRSALLEGDALKAETLEILVKMCPSKEEQKGLLTYTGDISELSPSERFLKAVLEIPFAFDRMKAMLFKSCFEDDLLQVQESLRSLEMACKEVRNSRLFLKLLEAVLKTGNRMNKGTARGDAEAFRLDSLLKLSDVKSADGKISLLHFVVAEIAKAEGMRESSEVETPPPEMSDDDYKRVGLRVMLQLGVELSNVKKVAGIDHSELVQSVKKLASGQASIKQLIQTKFNEKVASPEINSSGDGDDSDIFPEQMAAFIEKSEKDVIAIDAELDRVLDVVKEATTYFQGKSKEKDPLRMFVIVRDFLGMLEKVCMDLGKAIKRLRG